MSPSIPLWLTLHDLLICSVHFIQDCQPTCMAYQDSEPSWKAKKSSDGIQSCGNALLSIDRSIYIAWKAQWLERTTVPLSYHDKNVFILNLDIRKSPRSSSTGICLIRGQALPNVVLLAELYFLLAISGILSNHVLCKALAIQTLVKREQLRAPSHPYDIVLKPHSYIRYSFQVPGAHYRYSPPLLLCIPDSAETTCDSGNFYLRVWQNMHH